MSLKKYLGLTAIVFSYLIISLPFIIAQELNLQYDPVGNLVTGDGFYREYDGFNHLLRIRLGNTSIGNISEEFIWHPLQEKIFIKQVYFNNGTFKEKVTYLNKNSVKIENSSGTYYETYVYQDDILVAQKDANGNKYAVHNDHLGSTSLMTDTTGNVKDNSFYTPFGEQVDKIEFSRFSFTGKELDNANNEYDFISRRTKPEWANMFTTPDRVFYDFTRFEQERQTMLYDPQQLNPYVYARNNPYKYKDEDGNFAIIVPLILIAVAIYSGYNLAEKLGRLEEQQGGLTPSDFTLALLNVGFIVAGGRLNAAPQEIVNTMVGSQFVQIGIKLNFESRITIAHHRNVRSHISDNSELTQTQKNYLSKSLENTERNSLYNGNHIKWYYNRFTNSYQYWVGPGKPSNSDYEEIKNIETEEEKKCKTCGEPLIPHCNVNTHPNQCRYR